MEVTRIGSGYFAARDIESNAVKGLRTFLGNSGNPQIRQEIRQDSRNPNIFTVQQGNKKSYWLLNVITGLYHLLEEYSVPMNNQRDRIKECGRQNVVYPKPGAEAIAVRRSICVESEREIDKKLANANLLLSLLYTMDNHQEISKHINIGFIKSSTDGKDGWKMIIPTVEGGTLTQMFGTHFRNQIRGSYNSCYGMMNTQNTETVDAAKMNYLDDLGNQRTLVADLKKHYDEFCQHAKTRGYSIQHLDLTPYNVMYNNKERCLTLIDQDAWNVVGSDGRFEDQDEEVIFQIIEKHH